MIERLPYEEQLPHQWDALPLPDINMAWADMKRRLEEDDDRKPIAWWSRGCALWGFLLLTLLGTGWWLLRPEKWFDKKDKQAQINTYSENKQPDKSATLIADTTKSSVNKVNYPGDDPAAEQIIKAGSGDKLDNINRTGPVNSVKADIIAGNQPVTRKRKNLSNNLSPTTTVKTKRKAPLTKAPQKNGEIQKQEASQDSSITATNIPTTQEDKTIDTARTVLYADTSTAVVKKDTANKISQPKDTATTKTTTKADNSNKKPLFFSAGIALHQQLPVAGQHWTPYNAFGRKGSLADYIPSVYFRLNREDKWFLQAEFRYGAPQLNKELLYDSIAIPNTGQNPFTTFTSSSLKKTFYHQLPLTFNYFIMRNWTLGAGVQWNFFKGATVENESYVSFPQGPQDTLRTKYVQTLTRDSASQFAKNYFLGVVETEYRRKRFSIGARYTFGLQPYIRFSLPGGPVQEQKNTSLQVFLRYQLWRSK